MKRTITLIRHGKTAGNLKKQYIGITDECLCKEGEKELYDREYPEADIVFSSPLSRCLQTASIIYPQSEIVVIKELRETDFGHFEGKSYLDLADDADYQAWVDSGGKAAFPAGESMEIATKRTREGFKKVLKQVGEANNVSLVVHGGTIMAILSELFGGDYYDYHVENGEGYTFDLSFNGVCSGLHPRSFVRGS